MTTETYRILLVEDDDEQAELLKEYLTISGPFVTERTNTIKGFWKQISSSKYDAILMDYSLPDGDGISTLGKLTHRNHSLPVFIISGHCDERLAIRAMQLGAKEYLVKGTDDLRRLPSLMHKAVQETRNRSKEQKSLETNRIFEIVFNGTAVKDFYRVNFSLEKFEPTPNHQELIITKRQFGQNESQITVISKLKALRTEGATQEHIGFLDVMQMTSTAADFGNAEYFDQGDLHERARFHTIMGLFPEYIESLNAAITHTDSQQQTALTNLNPGTNGHDSSTLYENAGSNAGCILKNMQDLTGSLSDPSDSGSINPTIESAINMLNTVFQSRDINIVIQLAKNLPAKEVNRGLLLDLWITILRLSADRIPQGQPGNIYIQSKSADNSIQVDIVNDAVPDVEENSQLEPKDMRQYNAKSTNHDIEMDICLAIIQSLQGSMMIESVPRRGSIMRVTLPVEGKSDNK
jgi:DNA-binding response OmpR family regulator